MKLLCPAKINLTLEVLQRRPDGYHALRSVMVPIGLYDELVIEPAGAFSFSCDEQNLNGEDNLVVRAARAVGTVGDVRLTLSKSIPSQAGLGGGSSDAAAVLRAAMAGAFGGAPALDWVATARSLGSDVPFFLTGSAALVEGTGERVTALGALPAWHVLVVKPPAAVSTAAAYAELDRHERPSRPRNTSDSLEMVAALQRGEFSAVERLMSNDFHDVICSSTPEVARAIDALRNAGATNALLSGSGSAVFTLASDAATIASIAECVDLPEEYRRFQVSFATTPDWRGAVS